MARAASRRASSATRAAAASSRSRTRSSSCSIPKSEHVQAGAEVKLPDLGYIKDVATLHRDGRYKDAMQGVRRGARRVRGARAQGRRRVRQLRVPPRRVRSPRPSPASTTSWASASTGPLRASSSTPSVSKETVAMIEQAEACRSPTASPGRRDERHARALLHEPPRQHRPLLRRRLSRSERDKQEPSPMSDVTRSLRSRRLPDRLRPQLDEGTRSTSRR